MCMPSKSCMQILVCIKHTWKREYTRIYMCMNKRVHRCTQISSHRLDNELSCQFCVLFLMSKRMSSYYSMVFLMIMARATLLYRIARGHDSWHLCILFLPSTKGVKPEGLQRRCIHTCVCHAQTYMFHTDANIYMYVCMYVCIYTYIYIYIYIYI